MTNRATRTYRTLLGILLAGLGVGCAATVARMSGGGTGKVRVYNASDRTEICKVTYAGTMTAHIEVYDHKIPPGGTGELDVIYPDRTNLQQPVKMYPCGRTLYTNANVEFSQGKKHFVVFYDGADPPKLETPAGYVRYDARSSADTSELWNLPRWQDEKGVKSDWIFFSLRSKCDHNVDYKWTGSTGSESSITPPPPGGYKFWAIKGLPYDEKEVRSDEPITLWLRDRGKGGSHDWIEAHTIRPGRAERLEVDASCKSISERTDDEYFHGCYSWVAAEACQRPGPSKHPPKCPEGTPSVEGDMSKTCRYDTPAGPCIIRYKAMAGGCDVR